MFLRTAKNRCELMK